MSRTQISLEKQTENKNNTLLINMSRSTLIITLLFALLSLYTALAGTSAEGIAYLEAKGKEEGVVTLPSGLMYKELRAGNGAFVGFYRAFMLAVFCGALTLTWGNSKLPR